MHRNKLLIILSISIILPIFLFLIGIFDGISRTWYDVLMNRSLSGKQPDKNIVLVTVDRETLKLYGQYGSWTRSRYEGLLQEIIKQQPKVVVFDYFFGEKTKPESVDWDLIERLSGLTSEQVDDLFDRYSRRIRQTRYISSIDRDFAVLMKDFGSVILPYSFHVNIEKQVENTIESGPHSIYANASQTGYVNIFPDADGIVRTLSVNLFGQRSLAERIVQMYDPKISIDNKKGNIHINYFSKPYGYTMIPFQNAYNGIWKTYEGKNIDLRNTIVIIGDAHESLGDTYKTPVGKNVVMPGVELIANEVQTLLENKAIHTLSTWKYLILLVFLSGLGSFVFWKLHSLRLNVLVVLVFITTITIFSSKLFALDIFFDPFAVSFSIITPFFTLNLTRLLDGHREKERVKKLFSRYVDRSIVDTIVDSGVLPTLTGEQREVTVSFSDVEGFTSFSETLEPKTLLATLNGFFEIANSTIITNKGTLGKYIGDAVMSFWGAPVKHKNHAILACKTALEIRRKLEHLNETYIERGLPEIHLKFGINTGIATVGSIGSELYSDYTVMGDNVNLASRLEGINKYYHTYILISEGTKKQLDKHFITREIDTIRVKGKSTPIKIYELLGDEKDEHLMNLKKHHESGLKSYYQRNWYEALCSFVQNESLLHDPVAKIFIDRINTFQQTPPLADWDGVWNFESK